MHKEILNNQKGSVFMMVLISLAILGIFSISAITLFRADFNHAQRQENKMQAYYLARSGAETLASYLIYNPEGLTITERQVLIDDLLNGKTSTQVKIKEDEDREFLKEGSIQIKTQKIGSNLEITSTGIYKGISDKVTVTLGIENIKGRTVPIIDTALFTVGNGNEGNPVIKLEGSVKIKGSIGSNTTGKNSIQLAWSTGITNGTLSIGPGANINEVIQTNRPSPLENIPEGINNLASSRNYPMPVFPSFPEYLPVPNNPNFTTPWIPGGYYLINTNGKYNTIQATSDRTITFDLGGGERIIRVKNLDISQGNIVLRNTGENGKLIFYVENSFKLSGSSNINKGGEFERVMVYYAGSEAIDFEGSTSYVGNIFVNTANIKIGGSGGITGHIITNGTSVDISGDASAYSRIFYAPNSYVNVSGSGKIKGALIAKSFFASGGGMSIEFVEPDIDTFPGEVFGEDASIEVKYINNPWK